MSRPGSGAGSAAARPLAGSPCCHTGTRRSWRRGAAGQISRSGRPGPSGTDCNSAAGPGQQVQGQRVGPGTSSRLLGAFRTSSQLRPVRTPQDSGGRAFKPDKPAHRQRVDPSDGHLSGMESRSWRQHKSTEPSPAPDPCPGRTRHLLVDDPAGLLDGPFKPAGEHMNNSVSWARGGLHPTCMLNKWRSGSMGGGRGGGRDQPSCRVPARTSTSHKRPLLRRACLIQWPLRKGGSCSLGSPQFNSLGKNSPHPPFLLK